MWLIPFFCCGAFFSFHSTKTTTTTATIQNHKTHFCCLSSQPSCHEEESSSHYSSSLLSDTFDKIYDTNGTLGILKWCQEQSSTNLSVYSNNPERLLQATLDASGSNKGKAAGILNAVVGSYCNSTGTTTTTTNPSDSADLAWNLLKALDQGSTGFKPDIVTLSLVYSAVAEDYPDVAADVLRRVTALHPTKPSSIQPPQTPLVPSIDWKEQLEQKHGIQVLHDDDEFTILNKPSGMVLSNNNNAAAVAGEKNQQPPKQQQQQQRTKISLEDVLLQQGMELSTLNPDGSRGFVHRLDRGTSGCLVVAKTNAMHARFISKFFLKEVEKSYICLVDTQRSNKNGRTIHLLPADDDDEERTITLGVDQRPAQSSYRVLERYGTLAAKLKVSTRQGRKHQVRLHCSKGLQTPILLDPRYGGEQIMYRVNNSTVLKECRAQHKFCLHADTLSIPNLNISVQAPTPEWWDRVVDDIRNEL
jgi:23S rRNA-/tRNA-specific pseudouridylate synthase